MVQAKDPGLGWRGERDLGVLGDAMEQDSNQTHIQGKELSCYFTLWKNRLFPKHSISGTTGHPSQALGPMIKKSKPG